MDQKVCQKKTKIGWEPASIVNYTISSVGKILVWEEKIVGAATILADSRV